MLQSGEVIQYLKHGKGYSYLGFLQEEQVKHDEIKELLTKNFQRNCKTVWCSELTSLNKLKTYNQLVVSKLTSTFGIIKWTRKELQDLDILTRKVMTGAKCHHLWSAVERLYLKRNDGGCGLISVEELHNRVSTGFAAYLNTSSSRFLRCEVEHNLCK